VNRSQLEHALHAPKRLGVPMGPSREPQSTEHRLVTVFIHLADGTTDRFDGIDERAAVRVHLALGKNPRGQLNILGRRCDREDIATADIDYGV
jgi:hypothetical protein